MAQTFREFYNQKLLETPIGDYQTIGNWDKRGSFHSKRDRAIIRHPRAIEITKKRFNNNDHVFNMYFVNDKEAGEHMELGRRDIDWVRQNLGDEVAKAVEPNVGQEGHVNIIFTNNRGDEGRPMTAWMMAHRMAHAFGRYASSHRGRQFPSYQESANTISWHLSIIMDEYGVKDFPDNEDKMTNSRSRYGETGGTSQRNKQMMMKHFFTQVCTFKSARDNNIRDWFEVLHELFAQYVTTGKVKFKPAPKSFGTKQAFGNGTGVFHLRGDASEVDDQLNSLANTLVYYFDEMLDDVGESILIM
jgi:hypothetical protein